MEEKQQARHLIRKRATAYDNQWRESASEMLWRQIEQLPAFISSHRILAYWSIREEVITHRFVERWASDKAIYLPVMQGNQLELRRFSKKENLCAARFGILEPQCGETINPKQIELMLIPAVGYDPHGNRLGHGKGFYDRLLCSTDTLKIGICFDYQLLDFIPAQTHDIPVDWVVSASPSGVTCYRNGHLFIP